MGSRVTQDDGCLTEVFNRIGGDVRDLVRCSLVCKQWSGLCWGVPALRFNFSRGHPRTLRAQEDVIPNILRKTAAANCLQELKVVIGAPHAQATGEWLVHAGTSLKNLKLFFCNGKWGPAVWTALSSFPCLESLDIIGDIVMPEPNQSRLEKLTSCCLSSSCMTADLLEAVVAACPVLKNLEVTKLEDDPEESVIVRVSSATLESLKLLIDVDVDVPQWYEVSLHAPMLAKLVVGMAVELVELSIASVEKLREMELHGGCAFRSRVPFEKLETLTLLGEWSCELMVALFRNAPMVTDLKLEYFELGIRIPVGQALGLLHNLKTLTLDGIAVESFSGDSDAFEFGALTVHLWLGDRLENRKSTLTFLKSLLNVHCARRLVLHCDPMAKEWRILLNLARRHPGRVEFKQDKRRF